MSFERAQKVADAVLYEGYVLYPYRASAAKNRVRWQFGVVVPRGYKGGEPWEMQTEVLVESGTDPEIDLRVRFLQVQARTVEDASFRPVETLDVGDRTLVTWEEGVEQRFDEMAISLADLLDRERQIPIEIPEWRETETVHAADAADGAVAGRVLRERWPLSALVRVAAESLGELIKVRVRIENRAPWDGEDREQALRRSLVGAHTLLAVRGGAFVSLLDPPPQATAAVASCANLHTWPVLAGASPARDVMLSSPIILYDYPAVAQESQGDLCDATEIDEILMLRVMTLTEEEKREARGTDDRARQIIERSDAIPPEIFERLHGAVRKAPSALPEWESFLNPPGAVPPEEAWIEVEGNRLEKGSRVRLCPKRRADSMDLFLAGREAVVEGVYRDVEDVAYVAVAVADEEETDETAGDLHTGHGRFFYFYPEEIEPLGSERRPYVAMGIAGPGGCGSGDPGDGSAGHDPVLQDQPHVSPTHTLIAGVGNVFLGDDGFGVEVARRLSSMQLPEGVRAADFGIRGIHLAYELLEGYESTILVDATPRGGQPGTVYLIEPDLEDLGESGPADAHGMDPRTVFALLKTLGGTPGRVLIVGCEPVHTDEEMGLSEPVAAGVEEAVRMILGLVAQEEKVCV